VSGIALIATRDVTIIEAHPGETVTCPPGEEHWHGAASDRFMEHLALWEGGGDGTPKPNGWSRSPTSSATARAPTPLSKDNLMMTTSAGTPQVTLNNGVQVPIIGACSRRAGSGRSACPTSTRTA
jgi:hypothetical protein